MTVALQRGTRPALAGLAVALLISAGCASSGMRKTPAPATSSPAVAAPAALALPPGVLRVLVGTAVRDRSATGVARCMIPEPLPAPQRFEPDTTEIAYTIEVDPQVVKGLTGKVMGDLGCPEPWSEGCVGYTVCGGGVCQSQYGATVKCPGDKPLKKGSYKISFTTGGKTVEVPFEIQ